MMNFNTMREQVDWAYILACEKLASHKQDTILKFTLLFNVFEARLFINGRGVNNLLKQIYKDLYATNWFRVEEYDEFGKFFVDRYIKDGEYNDYNLGLEQTERELVEKMLKQFADNKREDDLFYSYLLIAYRFRNNLFHGEKDVLGLDLYIDCFKKIIELMHKLLSDMIENKFDGLTTKYERKRR